MSVETHDLLDRFVQSRKQHDAVMANMSIFTLEPGSAKPISYSTLNKYFKKIFRQAIGRDDVHWSTHTPRKTLALNLWEFTRNIFIVQYALGHASVKTTLRYICYSDAHLLKTFAEFRAMRTKQLADFRQSLRRAQQKGQPTLSLRELLAANPALAQAAADVITGEPFDPAKAAAGSESAGALLAAVERSKAEKAAARERAARRELEKADATLQLALRGDADPPNRPGPA